MNGTDRETREQRDALTEHWGCLGCGYDLFGSTGEPVRCPECGRDNQRAALARAAQHASARARLCYLVAVSAGVGIWLLMLASAAANGEREAWDSPYLGLGFLGTLLVSFALGHVQPRRCWRWGVAIVAAQAIAMAVVASGKGGLWLVAVAYFGILTVLSVVASCIGALVAHRTGGLSPRP